MPGGDRGRQLSKMKKTNEPEDESKKKRKEKEKKSAVVNSRLDSLGTSFFSFSLSVSFLDIGSLRYRLPTGRYL